LAESRHYKLRMVDGLAELVRGMHPSLKKKVRTSLETILSDPGSGKALKNDLAGLRSFRVGRFRIIYKVSRREVQVVAIGPRSRIYEETFRLIKRSK
jgi:mRNA interferase RelE/StbE